MFHVPCSMFYVLSFLFLMLLNNQKNSLLMPLSPRLYGKQNQSMCEKEREPVKSNDFLTKRNLFPSSLKCNKPLVVAYDKLTN